MRGLASRTFLITSVFIQLWCAEALSVHDKGDQGLRIFEEAFHSAVSGRVTVGF